MTRATALRLSEDDWIEIEREACRRKMANFVKLGWHTIEQGTPYIHGWHVDAVSEHLEAVSSGQISRLVINVPPGTMKSSLTCVFFPAWLWGPASKPHTRFIGAAHEKTLATRDSRRTRLLIESDWFQDRWPTRIMADENAKTAFENTVGGFRQAVPVASMTGKRGNVVVWDDPINPEDANSPVMLERAIRIFTETLPTRVVDPEKSAIIIVMQRLHQNDVTGHILAHDLGYEHLMLPMEFEPERRCRTSIGFVDPRTEAGELLFPERFPRHVVERDKKVMGSYATAGQFQQRPAPREGGLFKRHWFNFIGAAPVGTRWVRGWDLAASTENTSAWTAGARVGIAPTGRVIIADCRRIRGTPAEVERLIVATAQEDGPGVKGSIPQDPGQAGKAQVTYLLQKLAGYTYRATPETGDKITRAEPLAAQAEAGNIDIITGDWNDAYLDELCLFPAGFSDQVDATTRAFAELVAQQSFQWYVSGD